MLFRIGTESIDCNNVYILNITNESVLIADKEGRTLELDLDAITTFEFIG